MIIIHQIIEKDWDANVVAFQAKILGSIPRRRDYFFKFVDFKLIETDKNTMKLKSSDHGTYCLVCIVHKTS